MSDASDLVTVGVFNQPDEAALARNQLEAAGIRAVLAEENSATLGWALTGAQGGVRLLVAQFDADTARTILDDKPWLHDDAADSTAFAAPSTVSKLAAQAREDEEDRLTLREKQATRAAKTSVLMFLLPPLIPYALYLLVCVGFSSERLQGRPRRHAWMAGLILVLLPLLAMGVMALASALQLFSTIPAKDDLRNFAHPDILVGKWRGTRLDAPDHGTVDMDLTADGRLRFRSTGADEFEASGSWAFDNFTLYVRFERVARGVDELKGQIGGWSLEMRGPDEIRLKEADGTLRLLRRR